MPCQGHRFEAGRKCALGVKSCSRGMTDLDPPRSQVLRAAIKTGLSPGSVKGKESESGQGTVTRRESGPHG